MKRELAALLAVADVQRRVLSLLQALGLVDLESTSYKGAQLTEKAKRLVENDLISEDQVILLQSVFPAGLRGSKTIVQNHVSRFLNENPSYSFDDVLYAAEVWVKTKGDYCGDLKYFFYKKVEGGEETRCLNLLETIVEDNNLENVI